MHIVGVFYTGGSADFHRPRVISRPVDYYLDAPNGLGSVFLTCFTARKLLPNGGCLSNLLSCHGTVIFECLLALVTVSCDAVIKAHLHRLNGGHHHKGDTYKGILPHYLFDIVYYINIFFYIRQKPPPPLRFDSRSI